MINSKKIIAVIPAYNSAKTLEMTLAAVPAGALDAMLVIDDGCKDDTVAIAKRLGATVLSHEKNKGYGAAQKTGYAEALRLGADVVVMLHSDFQYDPTLLPEIVKPIVEGKADVCFGSRMAKKGGAREGGMVWWRYVANKALTFAEESVFHLHLTEYHTGYRAYGRQILERVPFETFSNNYVFDTEMLAALAVAAARAGEIPIPTRYFEFSQSPNFRKSLQYGISTLGVMWKFLSQKYHLQTYPQFEIKEEIRSI